MINKNFSRKLNKSNSGFSLIELVVVIALMIILSVGFIAAFSSSSGTKVKTATQSIGNYLDSTQAFCLAKKNVYMSIEKDGDDYNIYAYNGKSIKSEKLPSGLVIKYVTNEDSTEKSIGDGDDALRISFDSATGGFRKIITAVNKDDSGQVTGLEYDEEVYVKKIIVRYGDSDAKARTVKLYVKTGKHETLTGVK